MRSIIESKVEDILERQETILENALVGKEIANKVILVTGAAGSIGREICKQVLVFKPKVLILLDFSESALFELEQEFIDLTRIEVVLSDIRDRAKMQEVFRKYCPEVVFHAAAYKHVPLMEKFPDEAIKVNIFGTRNIADFAVLYHVKKFIYISTDKAVNPSNMMGATKRAGELYIQSLNEHLRKNHENQYNTQFITVRFGNVLMSNGSVVHTFQRQIKKGGPVTITHPDMKRYFMTAKEACHLVLESTFLGGGGEVFVFDMGQPIKIKKLAEKLIEIYGNKSIEIVFSGLRDGEKLNEELFRSSDVVQETIHPRIKLAVIDCVEFKVIQKQFLQLQKLIENSTENDYVKCLKDIVPEYKSISSRFQSLDNLALKSV
jgi:FlaA1/EpsC-like NDP-sugar epimerase